MATLKALADDAATNGNRAARALAADRLEGFRQWVVDAETSELGKLHRRLKDPALVPIEITHDGATVSSPKDLMDKRREQ